MPGVQLASLRHLREKCTGADFRAHPKLDGLIDKRSVEFGEAVARAVQVEPPDEKRRVYCVGIALRRLEKLAPLRHMGSRPN